MRKFTAFLILILCISFAPIISFFSNNKVFAEIITTNRLEYFELDKPLAVDRDGNKIFIAQKDMIIVYHEETYDKIQIENGNISYLEKCGNHLLFLNGDKLHSLNLATNEISPALFEGICSFSVSGDYFAITQGTLVRFFLVSDRENFLYSEISPDYISGEISILNDSKAFAIAPDLTFYYFANKTGNVEDMNSSGRQGHTFEQTFQSLEQMFFDGQNQTLYFKTSDLIYRFTLNEKQPTLLLNLTDHGISNDGKFCVDNNLLLICDTQNDKVIEYDIDTLTATGFEISFTKINLPQDFSVDYNQQPTYVIVEQGQKLYDINLNASIQNGYFLFNGYFEQKQLGKYLVINEINDAFYLISGDCFALVLKQDYTPKAVELNYESDKYCYTTNGGNVYKYPQLLPEFLSFEFKKHEKVQVLSTLNFNNVNYAIIKQGENSGFIPLSFLINDIAKPVELQNFKTASTYNKAVTVYSDAQLNNEIATLEKYSSVILLEEHENCYLIKYDENSQGYVAKNVIAKRGSYTNKVVFVVILFTLSLTVTFIHFELKYLYKRKKQL